MDRQIITFRADDQVLVKLTGADTFAADIVSYIDAQFDLGNNWSGFDAVRAVWSSATDTISTVLDAEGKCVVPAEVLRYPSRVLVSLVGSTSEGVTLTDRLTTYAVVAFVIDKDTKLTGSETPEITPSQFDQFVGIVKDYYDSITDNRLDSEAWAVGKRNGEDVSSDDETYHNNSKYYADRAREDVEGMESTIVEHVDNWLDDHPEATTTVQDKSLTKEKFTDTLSESFGVEINAVEIGLREGAAYKNANNTLLQNALNSNVKESVAIKIPSGKTFHIGTLAIKRNNVKIYGQGKVIGSFVIGNENTQHTRIEICELTIDADGDDCIYMDNVTRVDLHDLHISNTDKAFSYSDRMVAQQVSRVRIYDNYIYNCNYALYGVRDSSSNVPLIVADIHFTGNMVEACKVAHVHVEGFDGGIISNNTFFFLSYMQTPAAKTNNIYIDYCNWTIIANNNLFEAGLSAIDMSHSQSVNIIGNHIAWCAQRQQTPAIYIHDLDVSGSQHFNFVNILGNNIVFPCSTGIKLDDVGHIKVISNNMLGCGSDTAKQYFYGTWDSGIPSYGIDVDSDCMNIQVTENSMVQNGYRFVATNNVIFDANITSNGVEHRIKTTTVSTTLGENENYGNIAIPSTYNVLAIMPIYSSATSLAVVGQYSPSDHTIQLRRVVSTSTASATIEYRVLYTL